MFKRILLLVSLAFLLGATLTNAGCASGKGMTDMMARVPHDTAYLKYVNVKSLRNDADLDDLYTAWKGAVDPRLDSHGIDHGAVNRFASGANSTLSKRFTLLVGKFDMKEIKDELNDRNYDSSEYKGVEVWKKTGFGTDMDMVALMGDLIILGNEAGVEGCIKVIKEGEASLLGNADANDVAGHLPNGLRVEIQKTEVAGLLLSGLEASGTSVSKKNSDTLKISGIATFDDEQDARDADGKIENLMESVYKRVDVARAGVLVKASAELDIDKAASLFQGL